jgi:hypothetical protein
MKVEFASALPGGMKLSVSLRTKTRRYASDIPLLLRDSGIL